MTTDPTYHEMVDLLSSKFNGLARESVLDVAKAIYWFASDYHSGQSSNLYSAISQSALPSWIDGG